MAIVQGALFFCYYFALQCCQVAYAPNNSSTGIYMIPNLSVTRYTSSFFSSTTSMPITSTINITSAIVSATYTVKSSVTNTTENNTTTSTKTTEPPTESGLKLKTWEYIAIGAGIGCSLIIVIVIVVLCCWKKNKTRVLPNVPGTTHQMDPVEDEHHLVPPPSVEK